MNSFVSIVYYCLTGILQSSVRFLTLFPCLKINKETCTNCSQKITSCLDFHCDILHTQVCSTLSYGLPTLYNLCQVLIIGVIVLCISIVSTSFVLLTDLLCLICLIGDIWYYCVFQEGALKQNCLLFSKIIVLWLVCSDDSNLWKWYNYDNYTHLVCCKHSIYLVM